MNKFLPDRQIIDGLKESDNEAQLRYYQNQFFDKYKNYIYKVAVHKCRNYADAEELATDITQEVFISAFKKITEFSLPADKPESDHEYILKAWLGKIANFRFLKLYTQKKSEVSIENDATDMDDVLCPMCDEFLVEEKGVLVCTNGHYKTKKEKTVEAKPISEDNGADLIEFIYSDTSDDVIITNELRQKLQDALNSLKENQKHILLTYAAEGCLGTGKHIEDTTLEYLCQTYDTTKENIRQIKIRALEKIKKICFTTN